jgi:hypothetical protein
MSIPDRIYKIAKNYLDAARSRWDEIDSSAQRELDDHVASPALSAFERAQAKIRNAQGDNQATKELNGSLNQANFTQAPSEATLEDPPLPLVTPTPSQNALLGAYKVLGVPEGSTLPTVQKAYQELQQRADPSKFPAGSQEQKMAQDIHRRVNGAYILLANALSPASDDRFDRLELY